MEILNINKHKNIYLSGKMSGLPDHGFSEFKKASSSLRAVGFQVFDPSETENGDTSKSWEYYMKIDIREVTKSDAVVVLPGWGTSKGATEEVRIARILKIPVFSYPSCLLIEEPKIEEPKVLKEDGATKFDSGKLRFDLIPPSTEIALAQVLTHGAKCYADENWRKGSSWKRIYAATKRHLNQWYDPRQSDIDDSGPNPSHLNHLKHALCNIAFLIEFLESHPELDDRVKEDKV